MEKSLSQILSGCSCTSDERKSTWSILMTFWLKLNVLIFASFCANSHTKDFWLGKPFFSFLPSKYCKPIFDVSLFELKKDIFNVYSISSNRANLFFRHQMERERKREREREAWHLLYRISSSSRWKWKILIKQKKLKDRIR